MRSGDPYEVTTTLREDGLVYRFDAAVDGAFWLARQLCEQWLRDHHVRSDAIGDVLLIVNELCVGAHDGRVLRVNVIGDGVVVEVTAPAPDPLDTSRHGDLRLAAALCDEVVLRVTPEGSVVLARRHGIVLP